MQTIEYGVQCPDSKVYSNDRMTLKDATELARQWSREAPGANRVVESVVERSTWVPHSLHLHRKTA